MWYNKLMIWLLRSPLHGMISRSIMLITYSGRKSGRVYTLPVNYLREDGLFTVISFRDRTWWRNLRGGAQVTLRVMGLDLKAVGEVVEDEERVTRLLLVFLQKLPHYARYFDISSGIDGEPKIEDATEAAMKRVVIRLHLQRA
jgi:deazaflavin-dependent oxidoreductase (nitroreductase family)